MFDILENSINSRMLVSSCQTFNLIILMVDSRNIDSDNRIDPIDRDWSDSKTVMTLPNISQQSYANSSNIYEQINKII